MAGSLSCDSFTALPECPPACWGDEWPEPKAPQGEALVQYQATTVPEGTISRNAPLLAVGIEKSRLLPFTVAGHADVGQGRHASHRPGG